MRGPFISATWSLHFHFVSFCSRQRWRVCKSQAHELFQFFWLVWRCANTIYFSRKFLFAIRRGAWHCFLVAKKSFHIFFMYCTHLTATRIPCLADFFSFVFLSDSFVRINNASKLTHHHFFSVIKRANGPNESALPKRNLKTATGAGALTRQLKVAWCMHRFLSVYFRTNWVVENWNGFCSDHKLQWNPPFRWNFMYAFPVQCSPHGVLDEFIFRSTISIKCVVDFQIKWKWIYSEFTFGFYRVNLILIVQQIVWVLWIDVRHSSEIWVITRLNQAKFGRTSRETFLLSHELIAFFSLNGKNSHLNAVTFTCQSRRAWWSLRSKCHWNSLIPVKGFRTNWTTFAKKIGESSPVVFVHHCT